jgi:hypothetical protein
MPLQSNVHFAAVPPADVPAPASGYYALFVSDGSSSTVAGTLYKKDSTGTVTASQDHSADFTNAKAQDAVGGALQSSGTILLTYNSGGHFITADIKPTSISAAQLVDAGITGAKLADAAIIPAKLADNAITTLKLADLNVTTVKLADLAVSTIKLADTAVTNAKLATMAQATFKMRATASGTGAPIDGTPAQAKTALAITAADVSGLGTAATTNATAYDAAGLAAAAQAASQPLNSDLTAISALSTTAFGRTLLTVADSAAHTTTVDLATQNANGLLSATDKQRLDVVGQLGSLTAPSSGTGTRVFLSVPISPLLGVAGQTFRIRTQGNSATAGGTTLIFRVYVGTNGTTSDTVAWVSTTSAAIVTNLRAGFDGVLTIRTVGGSGSVQCECLGFANTVLLPTATAAPAAITVNTTAQWYISLGVTASGTFVAQQALVAAQ